MKNPEFSMPKPLKITGRSSSITNAFVSSIIPVIYPKTKEIENALEILGMTKDNISCAYCGDKHSEWDHFRPLIVNQRPTGYISEIKNLVPSCGKCNQSKGNKDWKEWMLGVARLSPSSRKVPNLKEKILKLEIYVAQEGVKFVDYEKEIGRKLWEKHWKNWKLVLGQMKLAQEHSDKLRKKLAKLIK